MMLASEMVKNWKQEVNGVTTTEPKRVKVYILESNEWKDTGTGYCVGTMTMPSRDEMEDMEDKDVSNGGRKAHLTVSDEKSPDCVLLHSDLKGNTEYQRQEETLIVWKDLDGRDIALSFEESLGCDSLCDFIVEVQKKIESGISLVAVRTSPNRLGSVHEMIAGPVLLPSTEANQTESTLLESLRILNENTLFEYLKNHTTEFVLQSNYLKTLIDHFTKSEEQHLIKDLFLLNSIVKTLILYNQRDIIEQMVEDDYIMGIIGILEYNTEFPDSKANHRSYLKTGGPNFKEVIPLNNFELKTIMKKCFRLHFLKDVVLIRFLDDHHMNLILDIILDFETCIIDFFQVNFFIEDLVSIYSDAFIDEQSEEKRDERRKDGIKLLHQCVQMSKGLDSVDKSKFYKALVAKGLFKILNYSFNQETDDRTRILSTDIIITIIEHDILLIQSVQKQQKLSLIMDDSKNGQLDDTSDMTLLLILSSILLSDNSPGLKEQVVQALYTLLHPEDYFGDDVSYNDNESMNENNLHSYETNLVKNKSCETDNEMVTNKVNPGQFFQLKDYFSNFYSTVAPVLFKPFIKNIAVKSDTATSNDNTLIHLTELLSFICTDHARAISRKFILENKILDAICELISADRSLQLRLTAIRCFKNIMCLNDSFYHRYMISNNLYAPIIDLLVDNYNESNMANSCIQSFFKIISTQCTASKEDIQSGMTPKTNNSSGNYKKTNFILLNNHLFEKYESQLLKALPHIKFLADLKDVRDSQLTVPDNEKTTTDIDLSDTDITMNTSHETEAPKLKKLPTPLDSNIAFTTQKAPLEIPNTRN